MNTLTILAQIATKCTSWCVINNNRVPLLSIILLLTFGVGNALGETNYMDSFAATSELTTKAEQTGEESNTEECKWDVVEIDAIEPSDEILITMTNGKTIWALNSGNGTSEAPDANEVAQQVLMSDGDLADQVLWNIVTDGDNLTIYPKGSKDWLYCTNNNAGVRVGKNENKFFTISENTLKHTATSRYIGVNLLNSVWNCYLDTKSIKGQILAFYKKVCSTNTLLSLTDGDNTAVLNNHNGQIVNVEVTRPFTAGRLYTISLPFGLENVSSIFGNQAYEFTSLDKVDEELVLYFNKTNTIEACKPYLVEPTQNLDGFIVEDVTLSNINNNILFKVGSTTVGMEAILSAGENETTGGSKYWLASDRYLYNNETKLMSLRAMFTISSASGIAPRARVSFGENAATGLNNITNNTNTPFKVIENGQLIIIHKGEKFNAQGQRL